MSENGDIYGTTSDLNELRAMARKSDRANGARIRECMDICEGYREQVQSLEAELSEARGKIEKLERNVVLNEEIADAYQFDLKQAEAKIEELEAALRTDMEKLGI